jgi:electron transfer flavoprotein alpha subunit
MHTIKRIDPRRPFSITAEGLKRITLGYVGVAGDGYVTALGGHREQAKPRRTTATAQRSLLVAAHSDRGSLDDHARQTLAAAALLADSSTQVVLLVLGELKDDAAALGADKVIEMPAFDRRAFAPNAALDVLAACVAAYTPAHVFLPDNATGDGDLGRRYAAQAKASVAAHVVEIDTKHVSVYTQARKAFAVRSLPDVILLAPNAVDARLPFVGAGEQIAAQQFFVEGKQEASLYKDLGIEEIDAAQVALEEADFIVSAGNGVTDVPAFERLASTVGAAIGASRVAVDDGKFPRDKQIGATGKTVDASIYIAFGISGAVQHLQGIKDCRHVIAVNLDASAPIAKRANLTIIGDAQETIAALTAAAAAARNARANPGAVATPGGNASSSTKLEGALA